MPLIPLILLVPKDGLEPSRGCPHWILNPARLPIPPLRPDTYDNKQKKLLEDTISTSILKTIKLDRYKYLKLYQICLKINMPDHRYNKNIYTEVYIPITVLKLCQQLRGK